LDKTQKSLRKALSVDKDQSILVKEVIIAADVSEVYLKWTSEAGVKSFFVPNCKIELRPGGAYEMYFLKEAPEGSRGSEGCTVLSFLPNKMFSFTWNAPPQFEEIRSSGYHTWVVLGFEKAGENKTKLTLSHLGWKKNERWPELYTYFDAAWSKVLQNLSESFL